MSADSLKILIVDDSRIFRGHVESCLGALTECEIAGSVMNAAKAFEAMSLHAIDLVLVDSAMPDVDGFELARRVMSERDPSRPEGPGVILLVDPGHATDPRLLECLSRGVFEVVSKPAGTEDEIRKELTRALLPRIRSYMHRKSAGDTASGRRVATRLDALGSRGSSPISGSGGGVSERVSAEAILIGASTGGPKALDEMLPALCRLTALPILIVQHMPDGFTEPMAKHLTSKCGRPVTEGRCGDPIESGRIYVAPGGRHMLARRDDSGQAVLDVNESPPCRGLRPAADILFRSAEPVFGGSLIVVVLTGMGDDGTEGARELRKAGAHIIAQDEATSVVWGMPGSIVQAGLHHQVLPLTSIPDAIARLTRS
jgi:two-component system chemotaxis response regulator CheB